MIRWTQHQLAIFKKYPPRQYPKFYILPLRIELIHIGIRIILDMLALLVICIMLYWNFSAKLTIYGTWVFATSMQLIPSLYSFSVLLYANKLRQKVIKQPVKQLSMTHRSLFDYLSLSYLVLLTISILLTINIILSNDLLDSTKKLALICVFALTNLLLFRQIYRAIYGKPADRLIAEKDKMDKRQQDVQRSFIGIAASVVIFSLIGLSGVHISAQSIWLIAALSIFVQLAVFNRSKRWHAEDMNVYQ